MSKRIKDNLSYLQVLAKCKPKIRNVIIEHGPPGVILSICECSHNVLKGAVPLSPAHKRRLSRYKHHLRALANKNVSRIKKKKLLNQKGGNLLTALLPPVLSVLGSLLK